MFFFLLWQLSQTNFYCLESNEMNSTFSFAQSLCQCFLFGWVNRYKKCGIGRFRELEFQIWWCRNWVSDIDTGHIMVFSVGFQGLKIWIVDFWTTVYISLLCFYLPKWMSAMTIAILLIFSTSLTLSHGDLFINLSSKPNFGIYLYWWTMSTSGQLFALISASVY